MYIKILWEILFRHFERLWKWYRDKRFKAFYYFFFKELNFLKTLWEIQIMFRGIQEIQRLFRKNKRFRSNTQTKQVIPGIWEKFRVTEERFREILGEIFSDFYCRRIQRDFRRNIQRLLGGFRDIMSDSSPFAVSLTQRCQLHRRAGLGGVSDNAKSDSTDSLTPWCHWSNLVTQALWTKQCALKVRKIQ